MKTVSLLVKGSGGNVHDKTQEAEVLQHSVIRFDGNGDARTSSPFGFFTTFPLLTAAAVAAGTDKLLLNAGAGTEVISRAAKGGEKLATSALDNDQAMLIGIATTDSVMPLTAKSRVRLATRVSINQVTLVLFVAGLDETLGAFLGTANAGDGAQFLFDPSDELGLVASAGMVAANLICATKVAGNDTYRNSGIKIVAGADYELAIEVGEDLISRYYVNGALVATAITAHTSAASVGITIGVQNGSAASRDFECRYVSMERRIG